MTPTEPDPRVEVRNLLHKVAELLRQGSALGPEGHQLLAELVDELGKVVQEPTVPTAEVAHLTECAAHLLQAAQHPQAHGLLAGARDRLARAAAAAEAEAPLATGIARRLMSVLADLGI